MSLPKLTVRAALQGVGQKLVHLRNARRNAQVNRPVSDLNNKTSDDIRVNLKAQISIRHVKDSNFQGLIFKLRSGSQNKRDSDGEEAYLVGNLEFLSLPNVLRLRNSGLQSRQRLAVQLLLTAELVFGSYHNHERQYARWITYGCTCNGQFNLAPVGAHQLSKLFADTLEKAQSVVLGKSVQEVLNGVRLISTTCVFLELGHDSRLVLSTQCGCLHNDGQLGVSFVDFVQGGEGFCN
jgi:hypothetical protein